MSALVRLLWVLSLGMLAVVSTAAAQNYQDQIRSIRLQNSQYQTSIDALRSRISTLQHEIISSTSREESLYKEYQKLEREIAIQDRLLRQLQNQRRQIEREIDVTQRSYRQLEEDLDRLVASNQKSLSHLYKYGRTNEMALILTSGSLNQMLVRAYYLRKFDEQRERQAQAIADGQEKLKQKEADLAGAREKVRDNAEAQRQEREILDDAKRRQGATLDELRTNRRFLQRRLDESEKEAQAMENALLAAEAEIDRLLRLQREEAERLERLARARENPNVEERREEVARYSVPVYTGAALSEAEMTNISESFRNSRGNLPWPVENGVIVTPFGALYNKELNTQTNNPGVRISADPGSPVRAVHRGQVVSIVPLPSFGDVVMVNHGSHITAYGNLSRIMVQNNTIVNAGDVIGLSGRSDSDMGATVFFLVRETQTSRIIDPELWLKRQ